MMELTYGLARLRSERRETGRIWSSPRIHTLHLEDCRSDEGQAKIEHGDGYLFIVLKLLERIDYAGRRGEASVCWRDSLVEPVAIPIGNQAAVHPSPTPPESSAAAIAGRLPRITRLLALAVRFEGLLQEGTVRGTVVPQKPQPPLKFEVISSAASSGNAKSAGVVLTGGEIDIVMAGAAGSPAGKGRAQHLSRRCASRHQSAHLARGSKSDPGAMGCLQGLIIPWVG